MCLQGHAHKLIFRDDANIFQLAWWLKAEGEGLLDDEYGRPHFPLWIIPVPREDSGLHGTE